MVVPATEPVALQVAPVAATVAPTLLLLVQVSVPVTVLPGAATSGRPVIALFMSTVVSDTVTVATALSQAAGVAVAQILYGTVYTPGVAAAGTVMVPSGFKVSGVALPVPLGVKPCAPLVVSTTFAGGVVPVAVAVVVPTWSLASTLAVVPPSVEPAVSDGSSSASMTATLPELPLLVVIVSLVALVVPVRSMTLGAVSTPPAGPGTATVMVQTMLPLMARGAESGSVTAVPATVQPLTVVVPATEPVALQVAPVADTLEAPPLVQVRVPDTELPGDATAGRPVMLLVMSTTGAASISRSGCKLSLPLSF